MTIATVLLIFALLFLLRKPIKTLLKHTDTYIDNAVTINALEAEEEFETRLHKLIEKRNNKTDKRGFQELLEEYENMKK